VRVQLTAADVLAAAGQPARAAAALKAAGALLQARAARIGDESVRESFLTRVPLHRQVQERLAESA
jgi:hypothetical protein